MAPLLSSLATPLQHIKSGQINCELSMSDTKQVKPLSFQSFAYYQNKRRTSFQKKEVT